ncbi:Formylmethanofuran dehydrogenase [Methanococcus aeolicus Nankai-3]|uniref:formylmethanofuran dehydrogenase n=1 Tax=Methanococcus aeolicus (strain ATCC BAA-1280 / DSM 17508 / OCM 812 / Nankai-3) TaxID=419665 RepID=A6UT54_META3|nr:formylmethanofuran dehydrogenase subunit C [Methanococcus aeolicus]ABR55676.1 Formylmethanofuran dehydrogenase [Methanococcus aeolicus Nankai-3]
MDIILTPTKKPDISIEADVISPDYFAGKTIDEIKSLEVWQGPIKLPLSDFFDVKIENNEKDKADGRGGAPKDINEINIIINGDVDRIKYIGTEMTGGTITINGNTGIRIGSSMKGGSITINGNAGSWTGMEMKGGSITINGNAGDYIGCAYRGSWEGMTGGTITINGNAGKNVATGLKGGTITINGDVDEFCGIRQNGGLIVINGNVTRTVGVEMTKGTLVVCGNIRGFAPGFEQIGVEKDIVLKDGTKINGKFLKFKGDIAIVPKPKGILYVSEENNIGLADPSKYTTFKEYHYKGGMEALLNTGSTVEQGAIIKGGEKYTKEYVEECAVCHIHPEDYRILGAPTYVKIISNDKKSEVAVKAVSDDGLHKGTIFMPRSIWANAITGSHTDSCGSPLYKGNSVFVEPIEKGNIIDAEQMIKSMYW